VANFYDLDLLYTTIKTAAKRLDIVVATAGGGTFATLGASRTDRMTQTGFGEVILARSDAPSGELVNVCCRTLFSCRGDRSTNDPGCCRARTTKRQARQHLRRCRTPPMTASLGGDLPKSGVQVYTQDADAVLVRKHAGHR
jgi:hypothetical protein